MTRMKGRVAKKPAMTRKKMTRIQRVSGSLIINSVVYMKGCFRKVSIRCNDVLWEVVAYRLHSSGTGQIFVG